MTLYNPSLDRAVTYTIGLDKIGQGHWFTIGFWPIPRCTANMYLTGKPASNH